MEARGHSTYYAVLDPGKKTSLDPPKAASPSAPYRASASIHRMSSPDAGSSPLPRKQDLTAPKLPPCESHFFVRNNFGLNPIQHSSIVDTSAMQPRGAVGIVESSLVTSLVQKLTTELEEIQELILDTLTGCLQVEAFEALVAGGVRILKAKLNHPSVEIRSRAAQTLMAISVPLEGKNMIFDEDVFPDLITLLEDEDAEVRANAAGALMYAAVTTQGKYAAINNDAIDCLLPLINDSMSKVRLYSIKALTMLAEAPEGRRTLLFHVPEFQERLTDPSEGVRRAAEIAVQVIQWRP